MPRSDTAPPADTRPASARVHATLRPAGPGRTRKVFEGPEASATAAAEAAAFSAVRHRHIAPLLDVESDGGFSALVFGTLGSLTATELIRRRRRLSAGEAVTLLVPLLLALLHLVRRGLDPRVDLASSVTLDDVAFDVDGAPVIIGLRAAPTRGPARLARPPGGPAGAARRLVAGVLDVVNDGRPHVRAALERELEAPVARPSAPSSSGSEEASAEAIDRLIELLFDFDAAVPIEGLGELAAASPISEDGASTGTSASSPSATERPDCGIADGSRRPGGLSTASRTREEPFDRLVFGARQASETDARGAETEQGARSGAVETTRRVRAFDRISRVEAPVRERASQLRDSLSRVRPRAWLAGAIGVASVCTAVGHIGASSPQSEAVDYAATPSGSVASTPGTGTAGASPAGGDPRGPSVAGGDPRGTATPGDGGPTGTAAPGEFPAPTGAAATAIADPLRAGRALLSKRKECLEALDAACLAGLEEPDSPIAAADAAAVAAPDLLAEVRFPTVTRVAADFGGAILLTGGRATSAPEPDEGTDSGRRTTAASVLLTRTKAGWLLRSIR